jgi:hypothetical protein
VRRAEAIVKRRARMSLRYMHKYVLRRRCALRLAGGAAVPAVAMLSMRPEAGVARGAEAAGKRRARACRCGICTGTRPSGAAHCASLAPPRWG